MGIVRFSLPLATFFSIAVFLLGIPAVSAPTRAQTAPPIDLAVSPPVAYLKTKPGENSLHTITLQHQGTTPLLITPKLVDFTTDGTSNQPILQETTQVEFITLQEPLSWNSSFSLKPKQSKTVQLQITPPAATTEKEYHLTVLFETRPDPTSVTTSNDSTRVSAVVASNLIVTVDTDIADQSKLSIKSLKLPVLIDSFQTLDFQVLVQNSGSNAGVASGSATIIDMLGNSVASYQVHPDTVLANSSRLLRTGDPQQLETLSTDFRYKPYFLLGIYTVDINVIQIKNDESVTIDTLSKKIVALPLSLLAVIGGGVLVYWFFVFILKQNQNSSLRTQN